MRQDDISINEAYAKIHAQPLEEGLWDTIKAKTAGVGGTISGLKDRALGTVQKARSGFAATPVEAGRMRAQGEKMIQTGKDKAENKKITSILKSKTAAINKLSKDIVDDLNRLGLNQMGDISKGIEKGTRSAITPEEVAKGMLDFLTKKLESRRPEARFGKKAIDEEESTEEPVE